MAEEVKAAEAAEMAAELPQITAGDLATMVRIIDASSQRGAFKGEELETVGALRNKLAVTVNALAPQQPNDEILSGDEVSPVTEEAGDENVA